MTQPSQQLIETAKSAQAFADYISLGAGRTLRSLAKSYAGQKLYKNEGSAFTVLATWSVKYKWQERISSAATAQSERMLQEASNLDADTFLKTSKKLNNNIDVTFDARDIVTIRESVRKPMPKGGSVNVSVTVEIRQLAEQMARELGVDPDEFMAEAEAVAAGAWGKS